MRWIKNIYGQWVTDDDPGARITHCFSGRWAACRTEGKRMVDLGAFPSFETAARAVESAPSEGKR